MEPNQAVEKMNIIVYYWKLAEGVGFYPMIAIAGMAVYFLMRMFLEQTKIRAIGAVLVVNFFGQGFYAFPKNIEEGFGMIFFTCLQAAVAIALYSFLEAVNFIDWAKSKFPKKDEVKP